MKRFLLFWLLLWVLPIDVWAATADPNATPATKALYSYLQGLSSTSDHRLISGQWIWRHVHDSGGPMDYATFQNTFNATGQYPGMASLPGITDSQMVPFIIDYWNKGGLIEWIFYDANLPEKRVAPNPVDCTALLADPLYIADLDQLVTDLKVFQDAGVVILFRPYAEMNGWWGWTCYNQFDKFIALWQHLFNYVHSHGVHNLLWVYHADSLAGNHLAYYPGNAYVDITGLDYYDYLDAPLPKLPGYDELAALGKPMGFGEWGPIPYDITASQPLQRNLQYFVDGVHANMPLMVFWAQQSFPYDIASQDNISAALNDSWVQNRPVPYALSPPAPPPPMP